MGTFDVRDMMKADAAGAASATSGAQSGNGQTRRFHPLAERIAAMPVKPTLSPVLIEGLARLLDIAIVLVMGTLVYRLYVAGSVASAIIYQIAIPALAVGALGTFQALQLYPIGALRNLIGSAVRLITGWTMLFLVTLAVFFLLKTSEQVSRGWLIGFYFVGGGALLGARCVVTAGVRYLTRSGRLERRTAIVGGGDGFRQVAGIAFDQGWIAHRRFVDDSDANDETVFDLDVNGHEILKDDAARGGRGGFDHGRSPCDDAGKRPQAAPPL